MTRGRFAVLCGVFVVTGATALCLQVVWHRVLTLHSGLDLGAATTVVVAFLAGLAVGNAIGGRLADQLGPRRSLPALAGIEAVIACFAAVSVPVLQQLPRLLVPDAAGALVGFGVYALALAIPTVLMGTTVPLVAEVLASGRRSGDPRLGWLYGLNSIGAAAGTVLTGWWLLGSYGAATASRVAAVAGLAAAVTLWALHRSITAGTTSTAAPTPDSTPTDVEPGSAEVQEVPPPNEHVHPVAPWVALYALSGAIAIGLQQVFFRLVDVLMRSNAYTFSITLGVYLGCFGMGAAIGSKISRAVSDPRRSFLLLQVGVAVGAAVPVIVLSRIMPGLSMDGGLAEWLSGSGFRGGFGASDQGTLPSLLLRFGLILPLTVLGPAVLAMGMSFPLAERIVTEASSTVGRRTGDLLAANTLGNVVGGLVTTFVLIDLLGSAGTLRALCAVGAAAGIAGLTLLVPARRPVVAGAAVLAATVVALLPGNQRLWESLHGGTGSGGKDVELIVAEDRTCVSAMKVDPGGATALSINGADQNDHPFDDFHVMIGLLPVLVHPDPGEVIAVGMGIGSTSFAALSDDRPDRVTTAELCGGNSDLIADLVEGRPEFAALTDDPRHVELVRDGRSVLRSKPGGVDVVVVDTLIPQSAASGNTYSREFYELVESRLADDGVFAQWVPTARVLETAASVFPHVVTIDVPSYNSTFMLAGREPLDLDPAVLLERFEQHAAHDFEPTQRDRLALALAELEWTCIRRSPQAPPGGWNLDLLPRDEFFMNHPARTTSDGIAELQERCDGD